MAANLRLRAYAFELIAARRAAAIFFAVSAASCAGMPRAVNSSRKPASSKSLLELLDAIFDSCLVDCGQALRGALTPCKAVFYSAEALSDFFFISKRFAGTTNPAFSAIA